MGLTIMAWGISLPDMAADTQISHTVAPSMGIAACFAGPMFNLLVGLGLSFSIVTIMNYPESYEMEMSLTLSAAFVFTIGSLLFTLGFAAKSKWEITRVHAIILPVAYVVFIFTFITIDMFILI